MKHNECTGVNNTKNPNVDLPAVTDFGNRALSTIRFSKMVFLPKIALANCGGKDAKQINVKLVQERGERYLKITPILESGGGETN